MASWLVKRIFWISCFAVDSYAFPSMAENGTVNVWIDNPISDRTWKIKCHSGQCQEEETYLKINSYLEETAKQEKLDIRDHEAVLTAIKNSEEFVALSETGELNNKMIAVVNVSRCDVENKTGRCVRNKRSVRRGNLYWKLHNHAIPEGYPKSISDDWDGLEGPLDASYTTHTGETYFYKGSQFWKLVNKQRQPGYPKQISVGFPGIPDDVDAVLGLKNNQQIYFFKGTEYWLYNHRLEPPVQGYPKPISEKWGYLLRNGIDAAFRWQDERVYFFKDDQYLNYNFETFHVVEADPPYPQPTAPVWFDCR